MRKSRCFAIDAALRRGPDPEQTQDGEGEQARRDRVCHVRRERVEIAANRWSDDRADLPGNGAERDRARKDFPRDEPRLLRRLTIEGQAMQF